MEIREATRDDLLPLENLERVAFSEPWSRAQLDGHLCDSSALTLVAEGDARDTPVGYAALLLVAGEAELLRIAVAPEHRRRGVARSLLGRALAALRERGFDLCHLEVREGNAPAIALYQEARFTLAGRRPRYYRDGTAALLYQKGL